MSLWDMISSVRGQRTRNSRKNDLNPRCPSFHNFGLSKLLLRQDNNHLIPLWLIGSGNHKLHLISLCQTFCYFSVRNVLKAVISYGTRRQAECLTNSRKMPRVDHEVKWLWLKSLRDLPHCGSSTYC